MKELEWPKVMLIPSSKKIKASIAIFIRITNLILKSTCIKLKEAIECLLRWWLLTKYVRE